MQYDCGGVERTSCEVNEAPTIKYADAKSDVLYSVFCTDTQPLGNKSCCLDEVIYAAYKDVNGTVLRNGLNLTKDYTNSSEASTIAEWMHPTQIRSYDYHLCYCIAYEQPIKCTYSNQFPSIIQACDVNPRVFHNRRQTECRHGLIAAAMNYVLIGYGSECFLDNLAKLCGTFLVDIEKCIEYSGLSIL